MTLSQKTCLLIYFNSFGGKRVALSRTVSGLGVRTAIPKFHPE